MTNLSALNIHCLELRTRVLRTGRTLAILQVSHLFFYAHFHYHQLSI